MTQFELLTAAAYDELARREVEVAVVEAGLGGRWDATNVLDAAVVVLTNVGLEHTRWLGPTVADIAREKLAVVRPAATLVLGDVDDEVRALAEATGARIVRAGRGGRRAARLPAHELRRRGRRGARADRRRSTRWRSPRVAAGMRVPGRLQQVGEAPLTILDGAHNPSGMAALAAALPDVVGERPLVAVVSVLDDKDAAGMLRALLPACAAVVFTASRNPRALSPATLASLAEQLGGPRVRDRQPTRGRRWSAPARWPAPTARCWRPARSTSWRT